jgi:hypothetical protein
MANEATTTARIALRLPTTNNINNIHKNNMYYLENLVCLLDILSGARLAFTDEMRVRARHRTD